MFAMCLAFKQFIQQPLFFTIAIFNRVSFLETFHKCVVDEFLFCTQHISFLILPYTMSCRKSNSLPLVSVPFIHSEQHFRGVVLEYPRTLIHVVFRTKATFHYCSYSGYPIIRIPIIRILDYPNAWPSPCFQHQQEKDFPVTEVLLKEAADLL